MPAGDPWEARTRHRVEINPTGVKTDPFSWVTAVVGCVLGCGQSGFVRQQLWSCLAQSTARGAERGQAPAGSPRLGVPCGGERRSRARHGQQGGLSNRCCGAETCPGKAVSALDPSPRSFLSTIHRGWSREAARRYVRGLTTHPERLVNTNHQSFSSTCGWILSSPWWKGKGQDVIFNFT